MQKANSRFLLPIPNRTARIGLTTKTIRLLFNLFSLYDRLTTTMLFKLNFHKKSFLFWDVCEASSREDGDYPADLN